MKKNIKKLLAIGLLALSLTATLAITTTTMPAFAKEQQTPQQPSPVDALLPNIGVVESQEGSDAETDKSIEEKLKAYRDLPEMSLQQVFATAIKTILFITGGVLTIGIIVAGIMFLVSGGNEEAQTKAKKLLTYLGIGIIVISASYALVSGIMQIDLFK